MDQYGLMDKLYITILFVDCGGFRFIPITTTNNNLVERLSRTSIEAKHVNSKTIPINIRPMRHHPLCSST